MTKKILTVGGASGIGLALAQKIDGAELTDISRSKSPISVAKSFVADVRDSKAVETAISSLEGLDALVYCAGVSMAAPLGCAPREDVREIIEVNLLGALECCRLALPLLEKSDDGRIVLLSSAGGIIPIPFDAPYCAAKAGLIALARELATETDVKCTAAIIGGTRTRFSFKRKTPDCPDPDGRLKRATDALIKIEQTGYTASEVADALIKLLGMKSPPPVYAVGAKTKLQVMFYDLLPQKLKTYFVKKTYGI